MTSTMISKPRKIPPGPPGEPFIGVIREAIQDSLAFNIKYWRQYGDSLRFPAFPWVCWYLFVHPDAVEHILQTNQHKYQKPKRFLENFGLIGGKGLITNDGDFHLQQRRLIQPAFHRDRIADLGRQMSESIDEQLKEWETIDRSLAIDIFQQMLALTWSVMGRSLFGAEFNGSTEEFTNALEQGIKYIGARISSVVSPPVWLPTPNNIKFQRAKRTLYTIVSRIIEQRRRTESTSNDLLNMLMHTGGQGSHSGMDNQQLFDEVITLLIAGHETVALGLTWTFYLLCENPHVDSLLSEELKSVLAGRSPTLDDLPRLPYTKMVFEEALRLYPPVWGQPRLTLEDDEIQGFAIARGTHVTVSQYLTHRHPEFWPDPERFDPERFLPEREAQRPKFAYFPFGGGRRTCLGSNFALMEGQLALASIAQRFKFALLPGQRIEPEGTCTLRPKFGIKASICAR